MISSVNPIICDDFVCVYKVGCGFVFYCVKNRNPSPTLQAVLAQFGLANPNPVLAQFGLANPNPVLAQFGLVNPNPAGDLSIPREQDGRFALWEILPRHIFLESFSAHLIRRKELINRFFQIQRKPPQNKRQVTNPIISDCAVVKPQQINHLLNSFNDAFIFQVRVGMKDVTIPVIPQKSVRIVFRCVRFENIIHRLVSLLNIDFI